MGRSKKQQNSGSAGGSWVLGILLCLGLCLALLQFPRLWERAALAHGEAEIDRALSACYAAEGAYPPTFSHLETYGLSIDSDRYLVHYGYLGDNLRPDVQVLLRGQRP